MAGAGAGGEGAPFGFRRPGLAGVRPARWAGGRRRVLHRGRRPAGRRAWSRAFRGDFRRRFGREPGLVAAGAYDATAVALKAIEATTRGELPGREAVAAAVRRVKLLGVTGEIELDGKGDRKKAVYSVLQVSAEAPERWEQNRVLKQVVAPPTSRN